MTIPALLRGTTGRVVGSATVTVLLAAGTVYGGDFFGVRDRLQPLPKPAAPLAHGAGSSGGRPVLASNPYWQTVTTLQGDGATTTAVTIADGALQWRVSWSCQAGGGLSVRTSGTQPKPLIDSGCPGSGSAFGVQSGRVSIEVRATGIWQLKIEQQLDKPVSDPPLAAMTAPGAVAVSTGSFYGIDQEGSGRVTLYRLADGSYALRLDNFYVTPNSSLDVRFSTPAAPHSDGDVANSAVAPVAELVATAGSMNFAVPRMVDPNRYGSLAIWCLQLQTVYSAATLVPVR